MHTMGDDRGEINVVKIFLVLALATAGYFSWVYAPLWVDYYSMRQAVHRGCNAAYASRNEEAVAKVILNGFQEANIHNEEISADGSIIRRPMEYSTALFEISITDQAPRSVTVDLEYEQEIVLPFIKRPRTVRWSYSHTEDLSPIKY